MNDAIQQLQNMGFRKCGEWSLVGKLKYALQECGDSVNVLYAFVCNGDVLYIGQTKRTLAERMQRYKTPSKKVESGQGRTNIRCNKKLCALCESGKTPEIWAWADDGSCRRHGFHVNLAAGLEDDVIEQIRPQWNIVVAKKRRVVASHSAASGGERRDAMDDVTRDSVSVEIAGARYTIVKTVKNYVYVLGADGNRVDNNRGILRQINGQLELGVSLVNSKGGDKITHQLGRDVMKALREKGIA